MKGVLNVMKKYFLFSVVILFCIIGIDSRQAGAYSVSLQKNGIYAEALPDAVVNNSAILFKRYVNKAMKYYKKYKEADQYTLISNVPEEYRIFIPIAKQIKNSDKIIIKNPFFIYEPDGNIFYRYYFIAEKNGKKLCLFCINISQDTKKISIYYDNIIDKYTKFDEKMMMDGAIFYKIDNIIYQQTKNKTSVVIDQSAHASAGEMLGGNSDGGENLIKNFKNKSYGGKKEEIFKYLKKIKNKNSVKKSEKNLKIELRDDYIEPEKTEESSSKTGIYIGVVIVAVVIVCASIFLVRHKRG